MLTADRKNQILDALRTEGQLRATELSRRFGVSEDTVRRDLRELDRAGLLRRVHGGALPRSPISVHYADREQQSPETKRRIGVATASLVRPGECLLIDSGTTPLAVAESLPPVELDVITHNLPAALALATHPGASVLIVGGRMLKTSRSTLGTVAVDAYRQLRPDTCIVGAAGADPTAGLTTFNHEDAEVKRAMVENARRVIAVMASEKLGTVASHFILPMNRLTHLVTDTDADEALVAQIRSLGVEVMLA